MITENRGVLIYLSNIQNLFTSYPTVAPSVVLCSLIGAGLRNSLSRTLVYFVTGFGIIIFSGWGNSSMALPSPFGPRHYINDSLVSNLDCKKLTPYNVLTYVRPDAFSKDRHIPFINWWTPFQPGNCWGLSQAQRRLFYLMRFNERDPSKKVTKTEYSQLLTIVGPSFENLQIENMISTPYNSLNKIGWFNGNFLQEPAGVFHDILRLFKNSSQIFKEQIESAQDLLQSDIENINILLDSRKHDHRMNYMTYQTILSSLKMGRMPLLVIKLSLVDFHVILVKRTLGNGLEIYDSNSPFLTKKMYYINGEFFIPEINMGQTGKEPLDIFLRGEDEMNRLAQINFNYYQKRCQKMEDSKYH